MVAELIISEVEEELAIVEMRSACVQPREKKNVERDTIQV